MRILLIEDDHDLSELLQSILNKKYPLDYAKNMDEAMAHLQAYNYGIVLLDRNLEGVDIGLSLITMIKERNPQCGILVISAYGNVEEKIEGLNLGADDYIEKPFDTNELLARINALSRRFAPTQFVFKEITIDLSTHHIFNKEGVITLTKKEDALLFTLLGRLGHVVSRDEIIDSIYEHPEDVASNTIDVMINSIRKKLDPDLIKTVKTRGYLIEHA